MVTLIMNRADELTCPLDKTSKTEKKKGKQRNYADNVQINLKIENSYQ